MGWRTSKRTFGDELEAFCSEIFDAADHARQLRQAGASDEELKSIMAKIDEATVRLKQLASNTLAQIALKPEVDPVV